MKVSVGALVEFVLRSGNIDSKSEESPTMADGVRAHRRVQKAAGDGYKSEVSLSIDLCVDGETLSVSGRADGIIHTYESVIIDEIKTTYRPLDMIDINYNPLHIAQAKCYAYIYAVQNSVSSITVRLSYFNIENSEIKYILNTFTLEELTEFIIPVAREYVRWGKLVEAKKLKRDTSIAGFKFPFDKFREGQRDMAKAVYKTIKNASTLFIQAPTGIGKTISALYPAVKSIGEFTSKVFYLTAKTIGRQTALETSRHMEKNGLCLKTVILTAKDKICVLDKTACNPIDCPRAAGHFDRIKGAMFDIFEHENILSREVIELYATKHTICPFEFSLDMTVWSDLIICDYNYCFDPWVYLRRFFANVSEKYVFLIDEAHNLPDRAREMFSALVVKSSFLKQKSFAEGQLKRCLNDINCFFIEKRKEGSHVEDSPPDALLFFLRMLIELLSEQMKLAPLSDEMLQLYFDAFVFISVSESYDDHYKTYYNVDSNDVTVRLFCVDPSHQLNEALKRACASVFFSATLSPIEYYRSVSGGGEWSRAMILPSPFPQENLGLFIADKISTKYKDREGTLSQVADMIHAVASGQVGNYFAFFPSYSYMTSVYEIYKEKYGNDGTVIQSRGMTELEKEQFLLQFDASPNTGITGFVVMGGIFSEGIDLRGDRLIGAVIVGVGLPQISIERDVIRGHFNETNGMGYEFAYTFPGINKVMQAAGRIIRSESDIGVLLLIDSRFSEYQYRELFPGEWSHAVSVSSAKELKTRISEFWDDML